MSTPIPILVQDIPEWEISLISASVGALIGTIIPFLYIYFRDRQLDKAKRRKVQGALCSELSVAKQALTKIIEQGKNNDQHNLDRLFVTSELPVYESFPLSTTFYDDINIDVLANSVTTEALKNLPLTYNMIYHLNQRTNRWYGGLEVSKKFVLELITQIDNTIETVTEK